MTAETQIKETVDANTVVLFMKGTKEMPQCGFSSRVAGVLNFMGVDFQDVNVLADDAIRQGIKDFSDWPTIPQLVRQWRVHRRLRYRDRDDALGRVGSALRRQGRGL